MNPLNDYPAVRQWVYRVFWIVGLALGIIQAYCSAVDVATPGWYKGALAVLAYLSIATNYTADRNVTQQQEEDKGDRLF